MGSVPVPKNRQCNNVTALVSVPRPGAGRQKLRHYFFSGSSKVHLLPSHEACRTDFTLSTALAHSFFRAALSDGAGSEEQSPVSHDFMAVDCSGCAGAAPRKGLPPMSFCAPVSTILPVPHRPSNRFISPACTWLPSIPIVTVPPELFSLTHHT